jgi:hypothetical protein
MKTAPIMAFCALSSFFLSGCVTDDKLAQVRSYATASGAFATQANAALSEFNSTYVDSYIQIGADENRSAGSARDYKSENTAEGSAAIVLFKSPIEDSQGSTEDTKEIKALSEYSAALGALANSTYKQDVSSAATSFYGAANSLNSTVDKIDPSVKISSGDLGILATIVNGIGDIVDEEIREKAIVQAVHTADPAVQAICKRIGSRALEIKGTYDDNRRTIFDRQVREYNEGKGSLSYAQRVAQLNTLRTSYLALSGADNYLTTLSNAAAKLASAHAKIETSISDKNAKLDALVSEIGAIKAFSDDMKDFYTSLKTTKP